MTRLALVGVAGSGLGAEVLHRVVARGDTAVLLVDPAAPGSGPDADQRARAAQVREVDTQDPAALGAAMRGTDAVLACTRGAATDAVRRAAVRHGHPLLDTDADVAGVRAARAELDAPARAAGLPIVAGISWRTVLGDLLTAVASRRTDHVDEVHVAYTVPDRGGMLAAAAPDGRQGLAAHLPAAVPAWVRGAPAEERLGEQRRLAWFPRPLGPHHAASALGLEPLWVPEHVPGVRTVRTYVAVSSLRAELLQAAGNLARWEPTRRRVTGWLERPVPGPHAGTRWACVAEVAAGDHLLRGWANGRDPQATTATALLALADAVLADPPRDGGLLAPARAAPADATLDALAATGAIRWSVSVPEARAR